MSAENESKELDEIAEIIYDYCCANRADNMKDGQPGDPRKVGCEFDKLFDNAKNFYRNIAKWHLKALVVELTSYDAEMDGSFAMRG